MTKRHTPPTRMSKVLVVVVKPFGPHHCAKCLGSVQAWNTRSRGASKTRVATIAVGSRSRSMLFLADTLLLLGLQGTKILIEPIEALFPQAAIAFQPVVNALQRIRFDAAGAPLCLARAGDESCALQHLEMLG